MKKELWDGWKIVDKIGEGQTSEVYKAVKVENGMSLYCAIKKVSLPKSKEEIDYLLKNGVIKSFDKVMDYYSNVVEDLKKEISIMKKFDKNCYIIDCYDYYQDNRPDNSGIDFYIRMELAEDIGKYFENRKVTSDIVIQLGIDICSALELFMQEGIIHRDIKLSNIYIGTDNKFKLGDFNTVSTFDSVDNQIVGTYYYMSPEVYFKRNVTFSTDLYSLGIVMYKLLNHGKFPFVNAATNEKKASKIRMTGAEVPNIKGVNKELMRIIKKACSFNEKDRYKNATEMKLDLEKIGNLASASSKQNINDEKTISIYDSNNIEEIMGIKPKKFKLGFLNNYAKNISGKLKNIGSFDKKKFITTLVCLGLVAGGAFLGYNYIKEGNKSCESGYVKKNRECVKGYYSCESGYSLNKDNKCVKVKESIAANVTYSCKNGYSLNANQCVRTDKKDLIKKYQCLDGYVLQNNVCVKNNVIKPSVSLSCSSGYTLVGKECTKAKNLSAKTKYVCSDKKYTLSGTKCTYTYSNSSYITRTCNYGTYSESKGACVAKYGWYETIVGSPTIGCSKGTYKNNTCVITDTVNAELKYYCSSDDYTLLGNQCIRTYVKTPKINYTCSSGFTLKNNVCVNTSTVKPIVITGCPDKYVLAGDKCVLTESVAAEKKYNCSNSYTLNGDKCEKYETKDPKIKAIDDKK